MTTVDEAREALDLRWHRVANGLTLRSAAPLLGIDFTYLSKVENGRERPSAALLMRMGEVYGFDPGPAIIARAVAEVPAPVRAAIEAAAARRERERLTALGVGWVAYTHGYIKSSGDTWHTATNWTDCRMHPCDHARAILAAMEADR